MPSILHWVSCAGNRVQDHSCYRANQWGVIYNYSVTTIINQVSRPATDFHLSSVQASRSIHEIQRVNNIQTPFRKYEFFRMDWVAQLPIFRKHTTPTQTGMLGFRKFLAPLCNNITNYSIKACITLTCCKTIPVLSLMTEFRITW